MPSRTLFRFCERVAQIIRTEGVVCYGLGLASNHLRPEALVNLQSSRSLEDAREIDLDTDAPLAAAAQKALETRTPVLLDETVEVLRGESVSPVMLVPIIWTREPVESDEEPVARPVGLLSLWNKRGGQPFDDDDVTLVRRFAPQAAALLVEEQLQEFDEIQTAFATVPVGLMLVDEDATILVANTKALRILEADLAQSRDLRTFDYGNQISQMLKAVFDGEDQSYGSFIARDGETYNTNIQRTPDGQLIIAFTQSPFTTAAEELTGQVAHELRTPLTVIEGNLQTIDYMLGPDMTEDDLEIIKEFVGTALIQSSRMFRLIAETLNISRIHAGKEIELDIQEFDLMEAVRQVLQELADALNRHNVALEVPENLIMEGDRGKIISILDNFLKNAAKYSDPGTTITLHIEQRGDNAILEVRDQGIGIPPDALEKIGREAGFRTDISKKQAGGIGLGMVYVRRVIETHGGEMQIESELGVGSTFRAILPIKHEEG
ncbi:MAG: PAS domain-containing protein [Armatimonadetes bacterium]|nr:PAS domain-containing protein [Armatimonadota bacterium]